MTEKIIEPGLLDWFKKSVKKERKFRIWYFVVAIVLIVVFFPKWNSKKVTIDPVVDVVKTQELNSVDLFSWERELKLQKQAVIDWLNFLETAKYMKGILTWEKQNKIDELSKQIVELRTKRNNIDSQAITYDQVVFQ